MDRDATAFDSTFDPDFALSVVFPLAVKAYGHDAEVNPVPGWATLFNIQPGFYGFLAQRNGTLAIAIRGTETPEEWLEDFDAIPVKAEWGAGTVHLGFQEIYRTIRHNFQQLDYSGYRQVIITGHSLGAALAVLCAADLLSVTGGAKLVVYTWAGPRVGLDIFRTWFNVKVPNCYRIVNLWDIVPHLPNSVDVYEHVGAAVLIDGGFTRDFSVAHNLVNTYGPTLAKKKFEIEVVK